MLFLTQIKVDSNDVLYIYFGKNKKDSQIKPRK